MMPSKMTDNELSASADRGRIADDFAKHNELYVKHILPAIEKAGRDSADDGDWRPGKITDPVAISVYNAYNSGLKAGQGFIKSALARLVADGFEAQKEIECRVKK